MPSTGTRGEVVQCSQYRLSEPDPIAAWLAPQHLDVYLPGPNIAIEFQGEQHYKPVEFFGGEDGFARTVARDQRKRLLCVENGCRLFEVAAGYDDQALLEQLADEIARQRDTHSPV